MTNTVAFENIVAFENEQALQTRILLDIRTTLEAINDKLAQSSDSRSSAEIKTSTRGVDLSAKVYAGSDVAEPVCAVIEAFSALYQESHARAMNGWKDTVEQVAAEKDSTP